MKTWTSEWSLEHRIASLLKRPIKPSQSEDNIYVRCKTTIKVIQYKKPNYKIMETSTIQKTQRNLVNIQ